MPVTVTPAGSYLLCFAKFTGRNLWWSQFQHFQNCLKTLLAVYIDNTLKSTLIIPFQKSQRTLSLDFKYFDYPGQSIKSGARTLKTKTFITRTRKTGALKIETFKINTLNNRINLIPLRFFQKCIFQRQREREGGRERG